MIDFNNEKAPDATNTEGFANNSSTSNSANHGAKVNDSDTSQMASSPAGQFIHVSDLLGNDKPVEYLIDGLMEAESMGMLFAPPGMGKSLLAIGWSASIATGQSWLGRSVKQGAVFYLAGEGHAGISRRLRAWELHTGNSLAKAPLFISKAPARLMDMPSTELLVREIDSLCATHGNPLLIVIDTFARNMGSGDENSNGDIAKFVSYLDHIKRHLGCAFLIVHHTGHGEGIRARGGSALPAAMDSVFRMDAKLFDGRLSNLRLIHTKSKESELAEDVPLLVEQIPLIGILDAKGREQSSAVLVSDSASGRVGGLSPTQNLALDALIKATSPRFQ